MEENLSKIKIFVQDLLRVMDFSGEVSISSESDNFLRVNIKSPDAAYLIGRSGENLKALQALCRAALHKVLATPPQFILDVNDYERNRFDLLKEMALSAAKEVGQSREARWLAPMNAYERRIVHMTLADKTDIRTESEGEGDERRIVIKPN